MTGSIRSVFMHADRVHKWLMFLGLLGDMADGVSTPVLLFARSHLMNDVGSVSSLDADTFRHSINRNALNGIFGMHATRGCLSCIPRVIVGLGPAKDRSEVPNFLFNVMFFFSSYVVGFMLLWRIAIVGFPLSLLLVIPGLLYGRTLMEIARKIRAEYVTAEMIAMQAVSSVRTVYYAFTGEKKYSSEFFMALQGCVKLGLRHGLAKGFAIGSNNLMFAIWSFMAYYSSKMIMYHGAQGGTAYAVGSAITISEVVLGAGLANLRFFSDACLAGESISEVIMRVPLIDPDNMDGDVLTNLTGKIEFRHFDFSYPSRPETITFKGFSLHSCEEDSGLVGRSGSGKSTMISLLQRFYDPLDGEIMLDGFSIYMLRIKWLRSQLGLVSQEPTLFATSIKEDILFSKEDASIEEIVAAAKASNANNFISQLTQGYDTQVGERGIQLSGGQKQRIAIARAIIKTPRILLLDEATSTLDSESEKVVQEVLDNASVGRTTIIVTHRLSTIRHANNITVIQNGLVVKSGSHEELIRNPDGMDASLVNLLFLEKYHHSDGVEPRESQYANMSSSQRTDRLSYSSRRHSTISHSSSVGSIAASHSSIKGEEGKFKIKTL